MYFGEWDSLVPTGSLLAGFGEPWPLKLAKYGNSDRMRRCPEAIEQNNALGTPGSATRVWNMPIGSTIFTGAYAMNGWIHGAYVGMDEDNILTDADDLGSTNYLPENMYHLPIAGKISNIPTFADAILPDTSPLPTEGPPPDLNAGSTAGPGMGAVCISRHAKSVNVAFFDDHAESVPLPKLWALDWHRQWITPRLPIIP
jgi:prepilin-type processing-associated H-X9-DG protein